MAKILLIEDMKGVRDSLEMILSLAEHRVDTAKDGAEGIQKMKTRPYDLIVTDILMPNVDGVEVLVAARSMPRKVPLIAISAGGNSVTAEQALSAAKDYADHILEKPFSRDELLNKVQNALI